MVFYFLFFSSSSFSKFNRVKREIVSVKSGKSRIFVIFLRSVSCSLIYLLILFSGDIDVSMENWKGKNIISIVANIILYSFSRKLCPGKDRNLDCNLSRIVSRLNIMAPLLYLFLYTRQRNNIINLECGFHLRN